MSSSMKETLQIALESELPILLVGPPGTGKTSSVMEIAEDYGWGMEKVIGSIHAPTDFSGMPSHGEDGVDLLPMPWVRRLFQQANEDPTRRWVLFLDEIDKTPRGVQAAMLQLVLERRVGDTQLPSNVYIVAAANGPGEGGSVLPEALINRFVTIDWRPEAEEIARAIPRTVEKLFQEKELLQRQIASGYADIVAQFVTIWDDTKKSVRGRNQYMGDPFVSPRSLTAAVSVLTITSSELNGQEKDMRDVRRLLLNGTIGVEYGPMLDQFVTEMELIDPVQAIRDPRNARIPDTDSRAQAFIDIIGRTCERLIDEINANQELDHEESMKEAAAVALGAFQYFDRLAQEGSEKGMESPEMSAVGLLQLGKRLSRRYLDEKNPIYSLLSLSRYEPAIATLVGGQAEFLQASGVLSA